MSTPFIDTNAGKMTTISRRFDLAPLDGQLERIVGAHIALFGGPPACIYIGHATGLQSVTVDGHNIPIIATGDGWPDAYHVCLSADAPRKAEAA